MGYDPTLESGNDAGIRATVTTQHHTPKTPTKRDAFDEYLWTHHDLKGHTGAYKVCAACTDVWILVTDHPRLLVGF